MEWKQVDMPYDELSDFRELIRSSGRHERDFKHVFEELRSGNGAVHQRAVITGPFATRTYEAGHGTAWLAKFDKDLRGNVFS